METRAARPIANIQDALSYGALSHYESQRAQVLRTLEARHIPTVDETAQHLPIALANRYLDLKASGRI
jgi:uncharacterized protein (DUF58 family)